MRKILLLAFSLLIFLLSFGFFSASANAVAEDLSVSSSSGVEVDYELPYPGLLPDSPLYFLRMIRDRIISILIADPLKKAEFNLLQADKRLNAGIYLMSKGNVSLAVSTISKAENYLGESLDKVEEAKKQGEDAGGIEGKLKNALKKHQQELSKILKKVGENFRVNFEREQKRVVNFEERLSR